MRAKHHLLSLYDLLEVEEEKIVIKKDQHDEGKYVSHINVGHGGRDKIIHNLKTKYDFGRYAIETLLQTCKVCQKKKQVTCKFDYKTYYFNKL